MKYILLFALLLLSTPAAFAENKAYLKDGKIKLETEDKVASFRNRNRLECKPPGKKQFPMSNFTSAVWPTPII